MKFFFVSARGGRSLFTRVTSSFTLLVFLLVFAAIPGCTANSTKAGPAPDVPTYQCGTQLSGDATASKSVAAATGVASYHYTLDSEQSSIALALSGADGKSLGTITIQYGFDFTQTPTFSVEASYKRGGKLVAHQTVRAQPVGGRVEMLTRSEAAGDHALVWTRLSRTADPPTSTHAFQVDSLTLGAPAGANSPGPLVRTTQGSYQTLEVVTNGGQPDSAAVDQFLGDTGLTSLEHNDDFTRLVRAAEDPAWQNAADLAVRRCTASAVGPAEGALSPLSVDLGTKRQAAGCSDQQDPIATFQAEQAVLDSIGTGVTLTGILVAAGVVTAGPAILVSVAVTGYASYVILGKVEKGVQSVASKYLPGLTDLESIGTDNGGGSSSSGGGSGHGSGSRGDPHVLSFDGLAYEMQVAGEYVLAESTAGPSFVVQVRQEPISGICSDVAVNTALATRVGGMTVQVDPQALLLDGQPAQLPGQLLLFDNGDSVEKTAVGVTLRWHHGEVVHVATSGNHLDIGVDVPASRRGQLRGLLGSYDGDRGNELTLRDGTVQAQPATWEELQAFGASYRITQSESLFSYAAGQDTSSFSVAGFPSGPVSVDQLPAQVRANATQTCQQAGVKTTVALDNCILDVGCTGDSSFTKSHVGVEPDQALTVKQPIDFSGWTAVGPGNWVVAADGRSVLQTINGDPTFYLSPQDYLGVTIDGSFTVEAKSDDDYIGFVMGYKKPFPQNGDANNDLDTFLLSWKGLKQNGVGTLVGTAEEGFTLSRANGVIDPFPDPLWTQNSTSVYTVLGTDYGTGRGWLLGQTYAFSLTYTPSLIQISVDGNVIFSETSTQAGVVFPSGRFGFYNYSQADVRYADFLVAPAK